MSVARCILENVPIRDHLKAYRISNTWISKNYQHTVKRKGYGNYNREF